MRNYLRIRIGFSICCVVILTLFYNASNYVSYKRITNKDYHIIHSDNTGLENIINCPSILTRMRHGRWNIKHVPFSNTKAHQDYVRKPINPLYYLRDDGKCGNVYVSFNNQKRALCHPSRSKPCCFNNLCSNKSMAECMCQGCLDLRDLQHAEMGTWVPPDKINCPVREYTVVEACFFLRGAHMVFFGDSLVEQVYVATKLYLLDGNKEVALGRHLSKGKMCLKNVSILSNRTCRSYVNETRVCAGSVKTSLYWINRSHQVGTHVLPYIRKLLNKPQTIVVMGIGLWEWLDINAAKRFIKTVNNVVGNRRWPQLVWHSLHAPGILRFPGYVMQSDEMVRKYNSAVTKFVKGTNIKIFNTYNLTKGIFSYDGIHYGLGINRMKALFLFHYIYELIGNGAWENEN